MKTAPAITLSALRRHTLARSLFSPTTLMRAVDRMGFVQADPIRAPARAQDLTLRHRVRNYRAGDLERRYPTLDLEEDFFINYGFLRTGHHALMHPRQPRTQWDATQRRNAEAVLEFVRARGAVHPREVDAHFAHGKTTNWFGGSSNATTKLLDGMHYRGMLRVARRDSGVRVYVARGDWDPHPDAAGARARMDALVDLAVRTYAPMPSTTLAQLMRHACAAAPQWRADRASALARARQRLAHARVDGVDWYWPAGENPLAARHAQAVEGDRSVRLLAPFDPVVWDRRRFEAFWGWAYRFEAYTPAPRRRLGYYALPLLWGEAVVGWANLRVENGKLVVQPGYVKAQPREKAFSAALDDELQRMGAFLGL
jgi:uncharacterized protein YcaQ